MVFDVAFGWILDLAYVEQWAGVGVTQPVPRLDRACAQARDGQSQQVVPALSTTDRRRHFLSRSDDVHAVAAEE